MDVTTAFLQPFAAEFAPKLDGRQTFKETMRVQKKIPFKIIASVLHQELVLVLLELIFAIPGYWILGENFMAAVGSFYT